MEDNTGVGYNYEWGILIYQLPEEFMGKALRILPNEINCTFIDEKGLRVYFSRKENFDEYISRKWIDLEGILFYISSTVTCLTLYGLHPFASKEDIKINIEKYLNDKDIGVLDLYEITETNHYRIILDVPEILANFELKRIFLDGNYGSGCPMEFYCWTCDREGHKRYQCQKSLTEKMGEDGNGNRCVEDCSKNERNSKQGNFVRRTSSGIDNTRSKGDERSFNSSYRKEAYFTVADPKTSSTPTSAEKRMRLNPDSRKNEGVRGSTIYSTGTKIRKTLNTYPSKYVIKIINNTDGILPPNRLLDFLREVYKKKNAIKYAKKYTPKIAALIEQIRNVIYEGENLENSIDNKHIKILKQLRNRLESQQVQ